MNTHHEYTPWVCPYCGHWHAGERRGLSRVLLVAIAGAGLVLLLLVAGCGTTQPVKPKVPPIASYALATYAHAMAAQTAATVEPRKTITLAWDNPVGQPAYVTEFWATEDLKVWSYKTEVAPGVSNLTLLPVKDREFFRCRYRTPAGVYSEWNRL